MRIRTIKPEFWSHERIAEMQPLARLLFIGLWSMADRRGRLEDRPKRIKVQILPYDDCSIDDLLAELHNHDFIIRYTVGELQVIQINGFEKHQRISGKESEIESELPAMTGEALEKHRGSTGEAPEKHPGAQEGKGKERKGKDIPPNPPKGGEDYSLIAIPSCLDTENFRKAWTDWVAWRRVGPRVKNLHMVFQRQLEFLSALPIADAIGSVEQSLRNGWTGIFPLTKNASKGQPRACETIEDVLIREMQREDARP